MQCEEIRERIWEAGEDDLAELVKQHLAACAGCRSYVADFPKLRMGLRLLAAEQAPEPSWGFSARVLRRLVEGKSRGFASPEFLESAGRRVILATLVLVFTLFLAMILPSSGPVRRQTTVDAYWPQVGTASAVNYPVDWSSPPALPALVETRAVVYHESR